MTEPTVERPDMAGYGVPPEPEGALPWDWARQRLVTSRSYWVVTASADGRPHAMPVWGVWLPDDRFWFSCDAAARKARNLRANPRMTVAADSTAEVVSIEGVAVPAGPRTPEDGPANTPEDGPANGPAIEAAIEAYIAKYGPEMGMPPAGIAAFLRAQTAFVMIPERGFGIIETPEEFSARATRWRWTREAPRSR